MLRAGNLIAWWTDPLIARERHLASINLKAHLSLFIQITQFWKDTNLRKTLFGQNTTHTNKKLRAYPDLIWVIYSDSFLWINYWSIKQIEIQCFFNNEQKLNLRNVQMLSSMIRKTFTSKSELASWTLNLYFLYGGTFGYSVGDNLMKWIGHQQKCLQHPSLTSVWPLNSSVSLFLFLFVGTSV